MGAETSRCVAAMRSRLDLAGGDRRDEAQVQDHEPPDRAAEGGDPLEGPGQRPPTAH